MSTIPHVRIRKRCAKHWCLTINNPKFPMEHYWDVKTMGYLVLGDERGESNTRHYQGFVSFKRRKSLAQVKGFFTRAFISPLYSTAFQAATYCRKDGKWEEFGLLPKSAVSTEDNKLRWKTALDLAKAGKIDDIDPMMQTRYYHCYKRMAQDNPPHVEDLDETTGVWIWGKTGVGKSYKARHDYMSYYLKRPNKWWDGYKGQPNVIIEDVDQSNCGWLGYNLKIWGDRYSFIAEHKGSSTVIRPRHVIVTSQYPITSLFTGENLEAISRRYKQIHLTARKGLDYLGTTTK